MNTCPTCGAQGAGDNAQIAFLGKFGNDVSLQVIPEGEEVFEFSTPVECRCSPLKLARHFHYASNHGRYHGVEIGISDESGHWLYRYFENGNCQKTWHAPSNWVLNSSDIREREYHGVWNWAEGKAWWLYPADAEHHDPYLSEERG